MYRVGLAEGLPVLVAKPLLELRSLRACVGACGVLPALGLPQLVLESRDLLTPLLVALRELGRAVARVPLALARLLLLKVQRHLVQPLRARLPLALLRRMLLGKRGLLQSGELALRPRALTAQLLSEGLAELLL